MLLKSEDCCDVKNSKFIKGDVRVSLKGIESSEPLAINELPELVTGMQSTDITLLFLQSSVDEYTRILDNIYAMADETGGRVDESQVSDSIVTRINTLNEMILEIQTFGELTVENGEGQVVLITEDLEMVDRLLLASLIGMADELNLNTPSSSSSKLAWKKSSPPMTEEEQKEWIEWIKSAPERVTDGIKRGIEGGNVLLAGTAIVVVIGGVILDAPIVAATGGIALVYMAVTYDFGTSAIDEKLTDAFVEKGGEEVNWSKKILKSLIRIGTEILSAGGSKLAEVLAVLQEALQFHESAVKVVCEDDSVQKTFTLFSTQTSSSTDTELIEFCTIVIEREEDQEEIIYDLSPYNQVGFSLTSYFVKDEQPELPFKHTSTLQDYGFNGAVSGDTYVVDKNETTGDGRWKRTMDITIALDELHKNITKIDYKTTNTDTTSQYREEYGFKTKSGSGVPLTLSSSTTLVYEVGGDQVCDIVESYFKRRYRSEDGELFDYIEHKSCDKESKLTITFSSR